MIVNTPAIDYLTLTSTAKWDFETFNHVMLESEEGRMRRGNLMQFKGIKGDSMFCGSATIQGVDTYLFRASGELAQKAALVAADDMPGRCTRIDLQITVPMPEDYSARVLHDGMCWSDWIGHQRPLTLIEGEYGLDTVYIGRRTAGDFTRIYVKPHGKMFWLRFETQFQKRKAVRVWPAVASDRQMMGRMLRGRVDALPPITDEPGMEAIRQALDYSAANVAAVRKVGNDDSTYLWLRDTVGPVIMRMINDHTQGDRVKELVKDWNEYL